MNSLASALNAAAQAWTAWMVSMSWQFVVLALGAALISVALHRRSAALRCLVWLVVFAKLVLPPWIATPWSAGNLLTALPVGIEWRQIGEAGVNASAQTRPDPTEPQGRVSEGGAIVPAASAAKRASIVSPMTWIMGIWLAGALAMAGFIGLQYRRYARAVLTSLVPAPESVRRVFELQRAAMHVRTPVTLDLSDRVATPSVFGAWRAKIILPAHWEEQFSERELSGVLAHELAHVKRGDLLTSWAISLLTCVYWFHPAVWLSNVYFRREREMACDDTALLATQQPRNEYASAILHTVESSQARVPAAVGLLGLLELSDNLLYRIRSIGDETRVRRLGWGSVALLVLVALFLPMGSWTPFAEGTSSAQIKTAEAPATPASSSPAPAARVIAPTPPAPVSSASKEDSTNSVPSAETRLGVAIIEFNRVGSQERLAEIAAQLQELVTDRLANDPKIRLVDRAKITQSMGEVKLDQSGLVDAASAAQLGKVVGARILIAAKVMNVDGEWVVTGRLIDAQTSEIAAVRVTAPESAGVIQLAEDAGVALVNRLTELTTAKSAISEKDPLDVEIAQIQRELSGRTLPRVLVTVPESHIGTWVPDPAGENEIVSVLTRVGFPVVDVSTFMKRPATSWWLSIFHGRAQQREGTEINVAQGFRGASDILHDQRLDKIKQNADIFIMGEAFSEFAGDNYGFKSCQARIEVKALDTATESIAAALSQHATAADLAEHLAGKKALRDAGGQLAVQLSKQLADYWQQNGKGNH